MPELFITGIVCGVMVLFARPIARLQVRINNVLGIDRGRSDAERVREYVIFIRFIALLMAGISVYAAVRS